MWRLADPQANEAEKVRWDIVRWTRGRGLDLGCGPYKVFPHVIGVDNGHHWGHTYARPPYISTETCEKLDMFADNSMQFVFSSHLLEHIEDTAAALKEWWRVIKEGGYLILYLPHADMYPNIGEPGANPDHKHDFHPEDVIGFMENIGTGWQLLVNEKRDHDNGPGEKGNEYSFLQVYRKKGAQDQQEHVWEEPRPEKTCCVVRFGGFGDHMQACSVFPELKKQGYHITYMTVASGYATLRENPHIDEWFIVDEDQVPNEALNDFWRHQMKLFDKWVNLSESVERTLLAMNWDSRFDWPQSVREKYLDVNYLEFTHELAQVPYKPATFFYPTDDEVKLVGDMIDADCGADGFVIEFCLSGSSQHKFYPWMDQVIARVMLEMPDAYIYTVGDEACKILEQGWEEEPRVIQKSGEMSIRQSMTLAIMSNVVMGPETGILNAVAFEDNRKVVMLSHSSVNNLTRDWKNTVSLSAEGLLECAPCHQLHYGKSICPRHEETGTAMCAALISPDDVFAGIKSAYDEWKVKGAA